MNNFNYFLYLNQVALQGHLGFQAQHWTGGYPPFYPPGQAQYPAQHPHPALHFPPQPLLIQPERPVVNQDPQPRQLAQPPTPAPQIPLRTIKEEPREVEEDPIQPPQAQQNESMEDNAQEGPAAAQLLLPLNEVEREGTPELPLLTIKLACRLCRNHGILNSSRHKPCEYLKSGHYMACQQCQHIINEREAQKQKRVGQFGFFPERDAHPQEAPAKRPSSKKRRCAMCNAHGDDSHKNCPYNEELHLLSCRRCQLTLGPETVPQAQVQPPPPTRRGQRRGAYQPPQPPLPPRMVPQQAQLLPQAHQQPQQLHPQLMQLAHQQMMAQQQQPPQMLQLPPRLLQQLQPHQLLQLLQQHPQMLHHPQPQQLIQPPQQPQFSVAQHLQPQQPFQPRMPNFPAINPNILRILMAGQIAAAPQSNLAPVGLQGGALGQQPAIHPAPHSPPDRRVLRQAEIATPPAYSSTPQDEPLAPSTSRSIQGIPPNGPLGRLAQMQVPSFSTAGGQIVDVGTAAGRWEVSTEESRRRPATAAIQGRVPVAQQYAQEAKINIVTNPALVTVDPSCRYNPASPGLIGAQNIGSRRDRGEAPVALLQVREEDLLPGGRLCPITIESPEIPKVEAEEAMKISPPETRRSSGNEAQISPGNDSGFNDASPEAGRSLNSEDELRADASQAVSPQDFDFPQLRREEEAGDRREENERGDEPAGGPSETIAPKPQYKENEQLAQKMKKKHEERKEKAERRQRKEEKRRRREEEAQEAGQEELMPVERDPVVVHNNEPERRAVTPIRLKIPYYPSHIRTHPRRSKRIVQPCLPHARQEASPLPALDTKKNCGMCTIHKIITKKYHKPCQFNTPEHLAGCHECCMIKKKRSICLALNKKR